MPSRRVSRIAIATLFLPVVFLAQAQAQWAGLSKVNDQDAPLKIVATTSSTTDMLADVTLRNQTSKRVLDFRLGWVEVVPQQCAQRKYVGRQNITRYGEIPIEPGRLFHIRNIAAKTDHLIRLGDENGAVVSFVQIAVVSVHFDDGSDWKRSGDTDVFDQKTLDSDASGMCLNGEIRPDLARCEGEGKRSMPSPKFDLGIIEPKPRYREAQIAGGFHGCYTPLSASLR